MGSRRRRTRNPAGGNTARLIAGRQPGTCRRPSLSVHVAATTL
jgi:hypothetical protein